MSAVPLWRSLIAGLVAFVAGALASQGQPVLAQGTHDAGAMAPSLSRIAVHAGGVTEFEGIGTPGSRITLNAKGRSLGAGTVEPSGRWQVIIDRGLGSGEHSIVLAAYPPDDSGAISGDEVRIAIPRSLRNPAREENGADNSWTFDGLRERAERLAADASEQFSVLERKAQWRVIAQAGKSPSIGPPSELKQSAGQMFAPVSEWLERSKQDYQGIVIRNLRQHVSDAGGSQDKSRQPKNLPPANDSVWPSAELLTSSIAGWLARSSRDYQQKITRPLMTFVAGAAPHDTEQDKVSRPQRLKERDQEAAVSRDDNIAAKQPERREPASKAPVITLPASDEALLQAAETRRLASEAARKRSDDEKIRKEAEARKLADAERKNDEIRRSAENSARKRIEEEKNRKATEEDKRLAGLKAKQAEIDLLRKAQEAARLAALERNSAEAKRASEDLERKRRDEAALRQRAGAEREAEAIARKQGEENAARAATASKRIAEERKAAEAKRATQLAAREDIKKPSPGRPEVESEGRKLAQLFRPVPEKRVRSVRGRKTTAVQAWRRSHTQRTGRCRYAGHKSRLQAIYVVKHGDTLWGIARRHYGDGRRYRLIYNANRRKLRSADRISACLHLYLPPAKRHRR